ncbi:MAG: hypothetical protein ACI8RD_011212 [Bacillariaceae sp.]|jgi:hypothetical protein
MIKHTSIQVELLWIYHLFFVLQYSLLNSLVFLNLTIAPFQLAKRLLLRLLV